MNRMLLLTLFCILSFVSSLRANTINALSCSQTAVQAATLLATVTDIVNIPAGNCTWNSPVTISKGMVLQGAGQDLTVISASGTDLLKINGDGTAFRLTGMAFTGNNSFVAIQIDGRFSGLRIDHVKFTNLTRRAVAIGYNNTITNNPAIYGLLDHITYVNNACHPFGLHYGRELDSWNQPDNWGTNQAFYVEDSTFTWNVATTVLSECTVWDQEHGARAVFRHNTMTNGTMYGHDTGSTQQSRGNRIKEVYSN